MLDKYPLAALNKSGGEEEDGRVKVEDGQWNCKEQKKRSVPQRAEQQLLGTFYKLDQANVDKLPPFWPPVFLFR